MSDQPRYETLELVVPEPPRMTDEERDKWMAGWYRMDRTPRMVTVGPPRPTRRSLVEVVGIVLQTVAWFLIGVLIGYTMASS